MEGGTLVSSMAFYLILLIGCRGSGYNMASKAEVWRCSWRPECGERQGKRSSCAMMDQEARMQARAGSGNTFQRPVPRDLCLLDKVHLLNVPK